MAEDTARGDDWKFWHLLDAVLHEPEKVSQIVSADRSVLEARNATGENVLRWLALENHFERVRLLRTLGSSIQEWAITEAIQHGHTEMVALLLELGGDIGGIDLEQHLSINRGWPEQRLSSRETQVIRSYFEQFSYRK